MRQHNNDKQGDRFARITRPQLAAIHSLKRQLELSDDCYRLILITLTGHRSAKHLDKLQATTVIDFFITSKPKQPTPPVSDAEALAILGEVA